MLSNSERERPVHVLEGSFVWVQALILAVDTESLERFPIATGTDSSQVKHGLGSRYLPAHARTLHAILDDVPARSLDYPSGDRVSRFEVFAVAHPVLVRFQEVARFAQPLPLGALESAHGSQVAQPMDDAGDLAAKHPEQALADKRAGLLAAFAMKDV